MVEQMVMITVLALDCNILKDCRRIPPILSPFGVFGKRFFDRILTSNVAHNDHTLIWCELDHNVMGPPRYQKEPID